MYVKLTQNEIALILFALSYYRDTTSQKKELNTLYETLYKLYDF